jgi:hypothetical protein
MLREELQRKKLQDVSIKRASITHDAVLQYLSVDFKMVMLIAVCFRPPPMLLLLIYTFNSISIIANKLFS